jgi:hypothetical protein
MRNAFRYGSMLGALIAGISLAAGQASPPDAAPSAPMGLTPAQKTAILQAVLQDGGRRAAPASFQATVGGAVPLSVPLRGLPSGAAALSPVLHGTKYTMVQNQVVLVDPATMRVIDILRQ